MIENDCNLNLKVLTYQQAYSKGIENVGGKAYSMSRLYKYNINVPKGIILPKENWQHIKNCKNQGCLEKIVNEIKKVLDCEKYVVRSSAIGEDSKDYSWAGCFESILNISSSELKKAIIECGESLYGKRAMAYKELHTGTKAIKDMGILVQEYIDADWSGVAFSINPVTGNPKEYVIECQIGKSGSVVGGYGDAITLVINKDNINERQNDKFPDDILKIIIKNIKQIQNIWKLPVDIEWVVKDKNIYITQTRPVTTA